MKKDIKALEQTLSSEDRYLLRLKEFSSFYLMLVVFSGVTYAAAIAIAVIYNVLIGVALAIFTAIIYFFFSSEEPKRYLGLSCKNTAGRIHVTHVEAAYGDTVYIPSRFAWADVTVIGDSAITSSTDKPISALYLPKSIERIGKDALGNNGVSPVIYYEGSAEEWEQILKETDLSDITVIFLSPIPELKRNKAKPAAKVADTEVQE